MLLELKKKYFKIYNWLKKRVRETLLGIIKYCFEVVNCNRFWLDVYLDNEKGINLYKSVGMHHDGTLRESYKSERAYLNQMIFSILKEEYYKK